MPAPPIVVTAAGVLGGAVTGVTGVAGAAAGVAGNPVAGVVGAAGAAGSAVAGVGGHVVSGIAGIGISAVFDAAGQWVASGAVWLLGNIGRAMSASTAVDLTSGWFTEHESVMAAIGVAVILPMVCCAAIQALYRQSAAMLVRTFLVQLPLALLLTGIVVELVQMAMAVTDALSSDVLASAGVDTTNILAPVSTFLIGTATVDQTVPAFVVFIGGLLVALAAFGLWLELVVRAAAVSVAVLFLPLALATMVWPAVAHWCRRLIDTLVALILSKLVIAAVLALAVGSLAGGLGLGATGGNGGGFAAVVTGIALLAIATLSPFTLLRLIPAIESGAMSHLESGRRHLVSAAKAPYQASTMALDAVKKSEAGADAAGLTAGTGRAGAAAAAGSPPPPESSDLSGTVAGGSSTDDAAGSPPQMHRSPGLSEKTLTDFHTRYSGTDDGDDGGGSAAPRSAVPGGEARSGPPPGQARPPAHPSPPDA